MSIGLRDYAREARELIKQLAESKQREATLTQERDAARNALEIARTTLSPYINDEDVSLHQFAEKILTGLIDPTAALAERDRAIERRTAIRCAELSRDSASYGSICREFNLDPKPEGQ